MNAHQTALARLTGARTQHTITEPVAKMVENALARHGDEACSRHPQRRILGDAVCAAYRDALAALLVTP